LQGHARRAFVLPDRSEESWPIFADRHYALPARDGARVSLSTGRGALPHHNHPEARVQDEDNGHNGTEDQKNSVATHPTAKGGKGTALHLSVHNSAVLSPGRSSHHHPFSALLIVHISIISLIKLHFQITPRILIFLNNYTFCSTCLEQQGRRQFPQCLIIPIERNLHDRYR